MTVTSSFNPNDTNLEATIYRIQNEQLKIFRSLKLPEGIGENMANDYRTLIDLLYKEL
jgi:uncharacterized protein YggT (Ycf19 family)